MTEQNLKLNTLKKAVVTAVAMLSAFAMLGTDAAFAHHYRTWGTTTTVNTAVWGQCTWGAREKFKQATGVYPAFRGHAMDFDNNARATGWTVALDAEARSIVVFEPGVQGANRTYGHVAWVNWVEYRADGRYIHITEMNWVGEGIWSTRVVKDVVGMSYVLAP